MHTTSDNDASEIRLAVRAATGSSDRTVGTRAAQLAASAVAGIDAERITIVHCDDSAPRATVIDDCGETKALRATLTLTHRDGRAIAAATPNTDVAIGIDIERDADIDPAHARYFLTPRERVSTHSLVERWVLKEAAWKALHLTDATPLTELELSFDENGELRGVSALGAWQRACARIARPWPGFIAALVIVRTWQ